MTNRYFNWIVREGIECGVTKLGLKEYDSEWGYFEGNPVCEISMKQSTAFGKQNIGMFLYEEDVNEVIEKLEELKSRYAAKKRLKGK